MRTSSLYATFHRPDFGNYQHWALHVHTDDDLHMVFQVVGTHGTYEAQAVRADPGTFATYASRLFLTTINSQELPGVQHVVETVGVDNETVEWDCQDYVLEILDGLGDECIVDGDEEGYSEAKAELRRRRGPSSDGGYSS